MVSLGLCIFFKNKFASSIYVIVSLQSQKGTLPGFITHKIKVMTLSEFIRIKKTAFKPQFKNLIGLSESGKTSMLCDFVTMLHPGCPKVAQGSKCTAYAKDNTYHFAIYLTGIVRTDADTQTRTMYKF